LGLFGNFMNKRLEIAEWIFTVLSIILYSGGPIPLILSQGFGEGMIDPTPDPTDYSKLIATFFLNYLVAFCLLILRWKQSLYVVKKEWTIWLLIGIACASILWSFIPKLTPNRSIALAGSTLFGFYIASRYSIRDQLKLLSWSFAVIMILSLLMVIIIPTYGTMSYGIHAGSWRGIYTHKNWLGRVMTISGIVFLILAMDQKHYRWLYWLGVGCSFCLLILSKSSSSIINCVTIFSIIPIYSILRWRYLIMMPIITGVVMIGSSILLWFNENSTALLGSIGKDATLTGRTDMWPYIIEMILKQPWLGYGYNGFWNDWDSPGATVWYAAKWTAPNAHNGILDLWLQLGLLGTAVFLIGFGLTVLRGLSWLRTDKSWCSFWPITYPTYLILANFSESFLLNFNDLFWVLYVAVAFSLATVDLSDKKVLA
jgi:exopolysaccharide production protein ExoQ